jgi:hypothetical protein
VAGSSPAFGFKFLIKGWKMKKGVLFAFLAMFITFGIFAQASGMRSMAYMDLTTNKLVKCSESNLTDGVTPGNGYISRVTLNGRHIELVFIKFVNYSISKSYMASGEITDITKESNGDISYKVQGLSFRQGMYEDGVSYIVAKSLLPVIFFYE